MNLKVNTHIINRTMALSFCLTELEVFPVNKIFATSTSNLKRHIMSKHEWLRYSCENAVATQYS